MKVKTKAPSVSKKASKSRPKLGHKYLLEFGDGQFEALLALKSENLSKLNVVTSLAFLIREAISEYIPKAQAKLAKASKGRLHAKVR